MAEAGGSRRSRGRGRRGRGSSGGGRKTFNSKGPTARVNGDAAQVYAKYQKLAEDAAAAGDYGTSESLYQHAEHYLRIVNAQREKEEAGRHRNGEQRDRGERGERRDRGDRGGGGGGERRETRSGRGDDDFEESEGIDSSKVGEATVEPLVPPVEAAPEDDTPREEAAEEPSEA